MINATNLYTAKYIVTMNSNLDVYENGAIATHNNKIIWIGKNENIEKEVCYTNRRDFENQILMPGLWNGHTHIAMSFLRGIADDLPLMKWLNEYIWPLESKLMSKNFVHDSSLFGIADLIKNGTIFFNDMYFHEKETAKIADNLGIRALLGEGILSFPTAGHQNVEDMINYNIEGNDIYKDNDRINFSLAPHSIYTCNTKDLLKVKLASENYNLRIHMHLSETETELEDSLKNFGKSPIEYLNTLGLINQRLIGAHGVWVNEKEREILKKNNSSMIFNVESNLKLASGIPDIASYFSSDISCSFGTDSVASNNNLDILEDVATAAKIQKGILRDATICPASRMIKAITIDSAKIFGYSDVSGSLEIGKDADFITLECNDISDLPIYNIYSHLLYVLNGKNINNTFVKDRCLMKNRIVQNLSTDLTELSDFYRKKIISLI